MIPFQLLDVLAFNPNNPKQINTTMSADKLLTKSFKQSWLKALKVFGMAGKDLPFEKGAKKHWFSAEKGISDIMAEVDAANAECLAALNAPKKLKSACDKLEKKSRLIFKVGDAYLDKVFKANKELQGKESPELKQLRAKLAALEAEAEIRVTHYKDKVKELLGVPDQEVSRDNLAKVYSIFQKEWKALDKATRPALDKARKTLDIKFKNNDNPSPKEVAPYSALIHEALGKKRQARFKALVLKYMKILPKTNAPGVISTIKKDYTRVDKLMDRLELDVNIMGTCLSNAKTLHELRVGIKEYERMLKVAEGEINECL